jgi:hypothetical protein
LLLKRIGKGRDKMDEAVAEEFGGQDKPVGPEEAVIAGETGSIGNPGKRRR